MLVYLFNSSCLYSISSYYIYKITTAYIEGEFVHVKLVYAPSNSLLAIPRRWFCCGTLLPVFGVGVSVAFHHTCVHIILIRFRLLGGHILGSGCSFGGPYVLFCILTTCTCICDISCIGQFWFLGLDLGSDCFSSWSLHASCFLDIIFSLVI